MGIIEMAVDTVMAGGSVPPDIKFFRTQVDVRLLSATIPVFCGNVLTQKMRIILV